MQPQSNARAWGRSLGKAAGGLQQSCLDEDPLSDLPCLCSRGAVVAAQLGGEEDRPALVLDPADEPGQRLAVGAGLAAQRALLGEPYPEHLLPALPTPRPDRHLP